MEERRPVVSACGSVASRWGVCFGAEEVYEFAERRADWYLVKGDVERAMYGVGCVVM